MRIKIGEYDVEIKASANCRRANKQDLLYLLNTISIWAGEAAEKWTREGCEAIAAEARAYGEDIYNFCDAHGLYKLD